MEHNCQFKDLTCHVTLSETTFPTYLSDQKKMHLELLKHHFIKTSLISDPKHRSNISIIGFS